MMTAFLSALLCLPAFAATRGAKATSEKPPEVSILKEGVWKVSVGGILCNACTRAAVEEVLKIAGVAKASFDFEDGFMLLTVAKDKEVRRSKVERALRNASRRVDLKTLFTLADASFQGAGPGAGRPAARGPDAELPPASFPVPTP